MKKSNILKQKKENTISWSDKIDNVISELEKFKNRSCTNCKWCRLNGEFKNDECWNTSLSGHLQLGTKVSNDFCCNRWEPR